MADPKFVRLAEHLADSTIVDIAGGSGWSIAGRDVQEFPEEDQQAARFVRSRLVQGLLESAGRAEFDEVQAVAEAVAEAAGEVSLDQVPMQEGLVQEVAARASRRLAEARARADADTSDDEEEEEEDDLDSLSSNELDDRLRAAGLVTGGNMEARKARLRA